MNKNYILRLAKESEADVSMEMINEAKAFLRSNGVDQWQTGYPSYETIAADIAAKRGYVLMDGEEYVAYMCIDFDGEPAYNDLVGNWLTEGPYGVMHRLATRSAYRGKGMASVAFMLGGELMKERGCVSFRVDTDNDNLIMKHLLAKNGFEYCGTIWFDNSEKIAFEKRL